MALEGLWSLVERTELQSSQCVHWGVTWCDVPYVTCLSPRHPKAQPAWKCIRHVRLHCSEVLQSFEGPEGVSEDRNQQKGPLKTRMNR